MPSLASLAEELLAQARKVDDYLEKNSLQYTSLDLDTLEFLPEDVQKLRLDLVDNSHHFKQLVRGARLSGLDIAYGWTDQVILRIIWRYKLASYIPIDGSATHDEISTASGLTTSIVVRTIRAAIPLGIFDEVEPGKIQLTAISKLLATDEGYYNSVGLQLEDLGPASLKLIEAWEKFGDDAAEPNQSAFGLSNGGESLFTVLTNNPDRAHRFDAAMKFAVEEKEFSFFDIVNAMEWSILDKPGSRLIDLGGGYGQISQALAKHTQYLAFIVQDLPHVVVKGREALPNELRERISFEEHSFMEPQQIGLHASQTFLISRCLHNWSDHHCVIILRALIPALRNGSRILIWDSVLDSRPIKKLSERFNLQQDFIMATISNGKDRTLEEFSQILKRSNECFKINHVWRPEGCKLSLIEVVWSNY